MIIRQEKSQDIDGIRELHLDVFRGESEANFIEQLRHEGDVAQSFVACSGDQIVGHCMLSSLISPEHTLFLGPIAVASEFQSEGNGRNLVLAAKKWAKDQCAPSLFVFGNPSFYGKFEFSTERAKHFESRFSGPHPMLASLTAEGSMTTERKIEYPAAFSMF